MSAKESGGIEKSQNSVWSSNSKYFHSKNCAIVSRIAKENLEHGVAPDDKIPHSCISTANAKNHASERIQNSGVSTQAKKLKTTSSLTNSATVTQRVRTHSKSRNNISHDTEAHAHQNTTAEKKTAAKGTHLNPFCHCNPCKCHPPCTCGLQKRETSTHTVWDANNYSLTHTVTDVYRPTDGKPASVTEVNPNATLVNSSSSVPSAPRADTVDDALAQLSSTAASRQNRFLDKYEHSTHGSSHHDADSISIRQIDHKGYEIEVRTSYEILIDGEPLDVHIQVSPEGKVHCHSIPNYESSSTVDLVRAIVDTFRSDFPPKN